MNAISMRPNAHSTHWGALLEGVGAAHGLHDLPGHCQQGSCCGLPEIQEKGGEGVRASE